MFTMPARLELPDGRILRRDRRPLPPQPEWIITRRAYSHHGLFVVVSHGIIDASSTTEEIIASLSYDGGFSATPNDVMQVSKVLIPDGGICTVQPGALLPHVTLIHHRIGDVVPGQQTTLHVSGHLMNYIGTPPHA